MNITPDGNIDIDTGRPGDIPSDVLVNNEVLSPESYTVDNGVVSISPQVFDSLGTGEQTVTVTYDDGSNIDSVIITDDGVPQSAYINSGAWSLFDLMMTVVTFLLIIMYVVYKLRKHSHSDDDDFQDNEYLEEQYQKEISIRRKQRVFQMLGVAVFVFTLIVLLITQDFTLPMTFFDNYSLLFAIFAIVQLLLGTLLVRGNKKQENIEKEIYEYFAEYA